MPVITLLTDFGTTDHYVAAMKGVILGICPAANLIDITHEIERGAISEAAYTLAQASKYFPDGTIHLVVVDPGVGSARRAILTEANGHFFVAPDNGVLTMSAPGSARHINQERFFRHPVSHTFHGRDIFAPVAAHLAAGVAPSEFGPLIDDPIHLAVATPMPNSPNSWAGSILRIDRFGNIVTNFDSRSFAWLDQQPFEMTVGFGVVSNFAQFYGAAAGDEAFAIDGSAGYLEVSIDRQSAAARFGVRSGDSVGLRRVIR